MSVMCSSVPSTDDFQNLLFSGANMPLHLSLSFKRLLILHYCYGEGLGTSNLCCLTITFIFLFFWFSNLRLTYFITMKRLGLNAVIWWSPGYHRNPSGLYGHNGSALSHVRWQRARESLIVREMALDRDSSSWSPSRCALSFCSSLSLHLVNSIVLFSEQWNGLSGSSVQSGVFVLWNKWTDGQKRGEKRHRVRETKGLLLNVFACM